MLLFVDIGNTNVKFAIDREHDLLARWRVATNRTSMPDEWWMLLKTLSDADGIDLRQLDGAVLSSSVPAVTPWMTAMIRDRLGIEPIIIGPGVNLGISVDIDNPREIGPDRLVDAAAAFAAFGGPVVVLDFGTATTLNVVSADGRFIGGVIAPDLRGAHDALVAKAARLTSVELQFPATVIGRNTVTSMQSGIMYGYVGLIDGLIAGIDAELDTPPTVVATGGLGALFVERCPRISVYVPDLTIDGLRLAWQHRPQDA